jgi:hypothetical protein
MNETALTKQKKTVRNNPLDPLDAIVVEGLADHKE